MLTLTSIIGNIYHDKKLRNKFNRMEAVGCCERLKISRLDTERSRLRRKTDMETDVGLILKSGVKLQHGDVLLSNSKKFIVIEQLPEKIVSIRLNKGSSIELLVMLGHIIGNRHRPIAIDGKGIISFPIQAHSELEVFRKLFHSIIDHIDLTVEEQIFQPQQGMNVHEH
ncbi:MAG: urease accessory protein UreE [Nitrosopumilaceae archaeon]